MMAVGLVAKKAGKKVAEKEVEKQAGKQVAKKTVKKKKKKAHQHHDNERAAKDHEDMTKTTKKKEKKQEREMKKGDKDKSIKKKKKKKDKDGEDAQKEEQTDKKWKDRTETKTEEEKNVDESETGYARPTTGCRMAIYSMCIGIGKLYQYLGQYIPCFRAETFAHQLTKHTVSFTTGILFLVILYPIFILALRMDPVHAALAIAIIGPFICFGMAFSQRIRCVMLLMMPQLFSGKGRMILMTYAFLLVLSGPVENLSYNMDIMGQAQVCGSELAMNQSNKLLQVATAPLAPFSDKISSLLDTLRDIRDRIKAAFQAMKDAIEALGNAVQEVLDWISAMVDGCNERLGVPEKRCRRMFEHAAAKCRARASIFGFVCGIVDLVANVCFIAGLLKLLCIFPRIIKFIVNTAKAEISKAVDGLKDEFYVDFEFVHKMKVNYNFSKSVHEVRESVMSETEERTRVFVLVITWLNRLLALAFIIVVIKAYQYYHKYRVKEKFDNCYVTEYFLEIDGRRKKAGKEKLFPLTRKERRKYITPTSFYLAKSERLRFIRGFILWVTQLSYSVVLMVADFTAYWFLDTVRKRAEFNVQLNTPATVGLHVEGKGIMADIYRALVQSLDPRYISDFDSDTSKCLPDPSLPDMKTYAMIGSIFGISLFLIVFEAYGLRLRRLIMSKHYPEREQVRAVWLYNQILRRRGVFKKFLMKYNKKGWEGKRDYGLASQVAARSKFCAKILKWFGYKWKFCVVCGSPGKMKEKGFLKCATFGCSGIYCLECVDEIHNMCELCSRPVDSSIFTDTCEFEWGSSEEDMPKKQKDEENALPSEEDLDYSYQFRSGDKFKEEKEKDNVKNVVYAEVKTENEKQVPVKFGRFKHGTAFSKH